MTVRASAAEDVAPPVLRPKRLLILTNHQVRLLRGLDALPHPRIYRLPRPPAAAVPRPARHSAYGARRATHRLVDIYRPERPKADMPLPQRLYSSRYQQET